MDSMTAKKGDRVVITGKSKDEAYLDKYVGSQGVARHVNRAGANVRLDDDGSSWYFAWCVLERAEQNEWTG